MKKVMTLLLIFVFISIFPSTEVEADITNDDLLTFDHYVSFEEMETFLKNITNESDVAKLFTIGYSYESRPIYAVKISDNVEIEENEPEIMFIGLHHAREPISLLVPLYIIQNLILDYEKRDSEVVSLVDSREIWIIPLLNVDGYIYDGAYNSSTNSGKMWRKNMRDIDGDGVFTNNGQGNGDGVDLNRNYDGPYWGYYKDKSNYSLTYPGTHPFSENETRAVRDLFVNHSFNIAISYHNYGELILYPWGYINTTVDKVDTFLELGNGIKQCTNYTLEPSYKLYPTAGDFTDWAYNTSGCFSFTIELEPAGGGFYDIPMNEIVPIAEKNYKAALYVIQAAGDYKTWIGEEYGLHIEFIFSAIAAGVVISLIAQKKFFSFPY